MSPVSAAPCYENLLAFLKQFADMGICRPGSSVAMLQQRVLWEQLCTWDVELAAKAWDISPLVASLRRVKSVDEIGAIYKAVDLTMDAHEAAASVIEPGASEARGSGDDRIYVYSRRSYTGVSVDCGSGKHSTVLHYDQNRGELRKGDLVVVDIGAELDYYCADLTRTYPVSGTSYFASTGNISIGVRGSGIYCCCSKTWCVAS